VINRVLGRRLFQEYGAAAAHHLKLKIVEFDDFFFDFFDYFDDLVHDSYPRGGVVDLAINLKKTELLADIPVVGDSTLIAGICKYFLRAEHFAIRNETE